MIVEINYHKEIRYLTTIIISRMKTIPTAKSPKFIQQLQWILNPTGYLQTNHRRYPDIFKAKVIGLGDNVIFTSDPEIMQYVLTHDRKQFTSPSSLNALLRPLIGDYSVIMLDSDRHRQRRQLVMPSFHGERLKVYGDLTCRITKEVMEKVPQNQPFLAREIMQDISLKVIMEAVFGVTQGERYEELQDRLKKMLDLFNSPVTSTFLFFPFLQKDWGNWSPWGRFLRQRKAIDDLIYAEISDRRANPDSDRTDILSLLMFAKDEQGQGMRDQELRDELMTLLTAGHETTASAMAWALYWLHDTPEVKDKLIEELDTLSPNAEGMDIFRLPYLTAVCNETLRLSPSAMLTFTRVVQEKVEVAGYTFESGDMIQGCMYLTHRREDLYSNPEQFNPQRFIDRQYTPYEFIPFGGGSRRCVGEALAQFEMKLVIATIMSQYCLKLADTQPEKQQRRGLTLSPARGVKMILEGKRQPQPVRELELSRR
ncbi:cytochrome P450 [Crocosphaera subtropica ATCC 51142]|uniref:Cytochrome P450 n=2 Tax=Crocosphaera TaxID=263510 RepID=B1WNZ4_CROS5|nr:cytochrome P450 [Crocosphaera subtropica ATCC 51142]